MKKRRLLLTVSVELCFEITLDGTRYTVIDRARERSVIGVTDALISRGAEGDVLDYLNAVRGAYGSTAVN